MTSGTYFERLSTMKISAYEVASSQVAYLSESELDLLEEQIALARVPCPTPLTEEELDAMEANHLMRVASVAAVNPHLAEAMS